MAHSSNLLKIYFVTWNVATKYPEQDLSQLLGLSHRDKSKPLPDLYVIGLQEVKSQPQNMVLDVLFEDPWTKLFKEALRPLDYVKVKTQRLQGLVLNLFCLRKHLTQFRVVETQYTKTGLGGMWGNKGAVSIRFNIYGVNICLINSHLTPHDHLLSDRISDYNTIVKDHTYSVPETSNIFFHDYIFWIGDLNFRLDECLSTQEIEYSVSEGHLDSLLQKDQLVETMRSNEAFSELLEEKISFPPTYKYEFASQEFDLKRRPSWTDRILYKVNRDNYEDTKLMATQNSYKSHSSYIQSDHKPVSADFEIILRSDVSEGGIRFSPITVWFLEEENPVTYRFLDDIKISHGDWIGLYDENFSSLDDYLMYEYVGQGKFDTSEAKRNEQKRISFSDTTRRSPGMYRLVYVSQQGNTIAVLGMSEPFPAYKRQT